MGTVPTPPTWAPGDVATAAKLNTHRDAESWMLAGRPLAVLRHSTTQTLTNNAATALLFDTEDIDSDNGHSTSSNTSRYTAQTAGWYTLHGVYDCAPNATGARQAWFRVNGAGGTEAGFDDIPAGSSAASDTSLCISTLVYLGVGDYVEVIASQSSGGNLATGTAHGGCSLRVLWERS